MFSGMTHEHCVGWHVMTHGEGRRDAITPLFRLMPKAPKTYFMDFACGCDDYALNYHPQFFQETQFFSDAFHGFSHKCSSRFTANRLPQFKSMNTSLMEQFNAFAQPVKGLLKSHTTKVSSDVICIQQLCAKK